MYKMRVGKISSAGIVFTVIFLFYSSAFFHSVIRRIPKAYRIYL